MTLTEPPVPATNPIQPATSADRTPAPSDREMTMLEHLGELRRRLVAAVLALVLGIVLSLMPLPVLGSLTYFAVDKLAALAPTGKLLLIKPGEGFFTFIQVSFILGVALAMPVIVYQVLAFVAPALYPGEKRYLYLAVPGLTLSFLAGVAFSYTFMLPFAIQFLGGFAVDVFNPQWAAEPFLEFVTTFLFWVGVVFELPLAMYFLVKLGVLSVNRLVRVRRYALIMAFIIGAIITPTPDPMNQAIVSIPIYLLFELGIILARFA